MKISKNVTYLLAILLLIVSCEMSPRDITSTEWKWGNGYHIGDVLIIDAEDLKGDTLYGTTIIYKSEWRVFADDIIYLRSLQTGDSGVYFGKWDKIESK